MSIKKVFIIKHLVLQLWFTVVGLSTGHSRSIFWLIGSEMSNDNIISESTFFFSHGYISSMFISTWKLKLSSWIQSSANRRCTLWQYELWSFQTGGTKLERFLPKNQPTNALSFYVTKTVLVSPKWLCLTKLIWTWP